MIGQLTLLTTSKWQEKHVFWSIFWSAATATSVPTAQGKSKQHSVAVTTWIISTVILTTLVTCPSGVRSDSSHSESLRWFWLFSSVLVSGSSAFSGVGSAACNGGTPIGATDGGVSNADYLVSKVGCFFICNDVYLGFRRSESCGLLLHAGHLYDWFWLFSRCIFCFCHFASDCFVSVSSLLCIVG